MDTWHKHRLATVQPPSCPLSTFSFILMARSFKKNVASFLYPLTRIHQQVGGLRVQIRTTLYGNVLLKALSFPKHDCCPRQTQPSTTRKTHISHLIKFPCFIMYIIYTPSFHLPECGARLCRNLIMYSTCSKGCGKLNMK